MSGPYLPYTPKRCPGPKCGKLMRDSYCKWCDKDWCKDIREAAERKPVGGSSAYYTLPAEAKELDDVIVAKDMGWHRANIFKAAYRWGEKPMPGMTEQETLVYDIEKVMWFAERALIEARR